MSVSGIDASMRTSPRVITNNYPYSSSIASSATSSTSSVFSADARSSQSSAPSSAKSSLHAGWESEYPDTVGAIDQQAVSHAITAQSLEHTGSQPLISRLRASEDAVPPELRQHPRRTQPSTQLDIQNGCPTARPPPPLVRQCDRKDNFVESLVDTTTQMIEVIWPLSVIPCGRDAVLGGKNLIGLRTFIQEVLKRSKTSYSTLQVALYYLVLIKPYIPCVNFTMKQSEDTHAARAMQCGRRMFLAALILASKYLQDRNYSARAWSKISGLKVCEINTNEMAFVTAIGWRLHVSEPLFQRWTDVVLKYSPPTSPSSPTFGADVSSTWRSIIPRLTPKLDQLDGFDAVRPMPCNLESRSVCLWLASRDTKLPMSPPISSRIYSPYSESNESTPTMSYPKPLAMEPTIRGFSENRPRFPPISPKITSLPTPQMTPQTANFSTPAVSASGFCPGKPSMSCAWKQVQRTCLARSTLDPWPSVTCPAASALPGNSLPMPSRRSSLARSSSSVSSPESMVSDVSTRSSRSSSISSVTSLTCALPQPRLAVQATRRCANLQLSGIKENCPGMIRASPEMNNAWGGLTSSPVSYNVGPKESFVRDCKVASQAPMMVPEFSDQDAAEGLRDLALNRHCRTLPPLTSHPRCANINRKRERPSSISDPHLQQTVRGMLQPRPYNINISKSVTSDGDDGAVLSDSKIADSFMLHPEFKLPQLAMLSQVSDSTGNARKRTCYMEENDRGMGCRAEMVAATGPGMWKGIL